MSRTPLNGSRYTSVAVRREPCRAVAAPGKSQAVEEKVEKEDMLFMVVHMSQKKSSERLGQEPGRWGPRLETRSCDDQMGSSPRKEGTWEALAHGLSLHCPAESPRDLYKYCCQGPTQKHCCYEPGVHSQDENVGEICPCHADVQSGVRTIQVQVQVRRIVLLRTHT